MKHWNDKNITSHHIAGGFWAHITWEGGKGIDQQGRRWSNPDKPEPEFHPATIELMKMVLVRTAFVPRNSRPA